MEKFPEFKWERPNSSIYPKVWHTFHAKGIDSNKIVEYRIGDLPESRIEEAIVFTVKYFCTGEPLWQAYGLASDSKEIGNLELICRTMAKQKTSMACFEYGSDKIVGMFWNCVFRKDDHTLHELFERHKCEKKKNIEKMIEIFDFNIYEHYGIDEYMSPFYMAVDPQYRGRSIGEHLFQATIMFCRECGLELISSILTSNNSNRIVDKIGFKLDKEQKFDEIRHKYPALKLPHVKSDAVTIKSMIIPKHISAKP